MRLLLALISVLASIPTAFAAAPASSSAQHGSPWTTIGMLAVFFVIFYFLLIRPQSKRAKAQKQLLASLGKAEEVMTTGGVMGKIVEIDQSIVSLEIASGVVIKVQKAAITGSVPKGTLKKDSAVL